MTDPDSRKSNPTHFFFFCNQIVHSEVGEAFSAVELQKPVKKERILSVFLLAVLTADVF